MRYTITYEGGKHEGSIAVKNDTMNDDVAQQYAATHLFDSGVDPDSVNVEDIAVDWSQA